MAFKDFLQKLKKKVIEAKPKKKTEKKKDSGSDSNNSNLYPNRFLKFYHHNKGRLLKERKSLYQDKKRNGICVRCNKKASEGIIFCGYHQQKQVVYNQQARKK